MTNEKYKKLIDDEKARRAFIERDVPYDPKEMESRMPLACGLLLCTLIAAAIVGGIYLLMKYFR